MKPIVAIVGRPNVGKSTLFNKLVGERAAIVDNQPGVTRDRLYRNTEWSGTEFVLVDTGGLEPRNHDFMMSNIIKQAEVAMLEAAVIIFLVEAKAGITALDEEIATILRKKNKPVIVVVNKVDNLQKQTDDLYEFWGLGFDDMIPVSAEHKINLGDMLDSVIGHLAKLEFPEEEEGLKLAIIGRPNAGKSSLTNRLCGSERTIVSDVAGTTRDAIDTPFQYNDDKYVIIDTAGIRRKSKIEEDLEYYSVLRAMKAIGRADVCIMMLDAVEGLTDQDKRIAGIAHEEKKPLIICVNKWDLVEKNNKTMKEFEDGLRVDLPFLSYAPILFISAFTGQRVLNILKTANKIYDEYTKRISTGLLNSVLKDAIAVNEPPTRKGRAIKINYVTQISAAPPKFAIFCNHPDLLHFSYVRYIENKFREAFGFEGCPIEFVVNKKND